MMKKQNRTKFFLIISICALISGCFQDISPRTPSQIENTITLVQKTNTQILVGTPTNDFSTSPTPTTTQFPTSRPTFTRIKPMNGVEELIATNGGCRLPCIWGITPGDVTWDEAQAFFSNLNPVIDSTEKIVLKRGSLSQIVNDNNVHFSIQRQPQQVGIRLTTRDDFISIIFIGAESSGELFSLHNLLRNYGKPQEIFIHASLFPGDVFPFHLVVLYTDLHFLVHYEIDAQFDNITFIGCPQNVPPQIYSWSQNEGAFVDRARMDKWVLGGYGLTPYQLRPLSEVTDMTLEDLYQTFMDPNTSTCIESPISAWP